MTETALAQASSRDLSANIAAALLDAQRAVLEMVVQNRSLGEVLASLCQIVENQSSRTVRAAILLVTPDGRHLRTGAAPSLPESYSRAIDGIEIAPHVGTCAAAAARRQVVVTSDIASDPAWRGLSHLPLELGLKAAWSLPILSATGAVLGTFGTYFFSAEARAVRSGESPGRSHGPHGCARDRATARRSGAAGERDPASRHDRGDARVREARGGGRDVTADECRGTAHDRGG